jgi:F0F1-type ATP synthase assembly protein I
LKPEIPPRTTRDDAYAMASGYATAFSFIGTILAFAGLGWLIDWKFGTGPWGILAGLGLGFLGATIKIVRDTPVGRVRTLADRRATGYSSPPSIRTRPRGIGPK